MESKFDLLQAHGLALPARLLTDTPNRKIKKIRVNGQVALRPLLCLGPIHNDQEFTLLVGAFEKGGEFDPRNAVEMAADRREQVVQNPSVRRCEHGQEPQR